MVVGDVRLDVEGRRQRRVVDDETRRVVGLEPGEGALEPVAVVGIVDEVDAPVLVDDGPDDDGGVVAVPVDDALEEALLAARERSVDRPPFGSSVQIRSPIRSATS
jgi:hypothetical protein